MLPERYPLRKHPFFPLRKEKEKRKKKEKKQKKKEIKEKEKRLPPNYPVRIALCFF